MSEFDPLRGLRQRLLELEAERDELQAECAALRAQLSSDHLAETRWLQRKVRKQAEALSMRYYIITAQRAVMRALNDHHKSMTPQQFHAAWPHISDSRTLPGPEDY